MAGGNEESIFQPSWSPDGTLYFVSDRTDWWNLYAERDGKVVPVLPMDAEFGAPQWVFGTTTYGFAARRHDRRPLHAAAASGASCGSIRRSGKHEALDLPYSNISSIDVAGDRAYAIAGSPTEPESLVEIDLATGKTQVIRRSSPVEARRRRTRRSRKPIEFPTDGGKTAHAFYYPPANRDFRGPAGEAPPLLVLIHGGPTSATAAQFRLTHAISGRRAASPCAT